MARTNGSTAFITVPDHWDKIVLDPMQPKSPYAYSIIARSDTPIDGKDTWYYGVHTWDVAVLNEVLPVPITQKRLNWVRGKLLHLRKQQAETNGSGRIGQTPALLLMQGSMEQGGASIDLYIIL